MATLKVRELKIEEMDLKKKKKAAQIMDEIRKKHKIKVGEKTSSEIIRTFRDTRYSQ